jgi:hypothetical protein
MKRDARVASTSKSIIDDTLYTPLLQGVDPPKTKRARSRAAGGCALGARGKGTEGEKREGARRGTQSEMPSYPASRGGSFYY